MRRKKQVKSQGFVHGAMILSMSLVVVKIIGFVYKILLQRVLDDSGSGYYYGAYSIFGVVLTIATAGIPVAVSRLIASNTEQRNYRNIVKIKNLTIKITAILGLIGSVVVILVAYPITRNIIDEGALYSIMVIAPAVFFICLMSAYRGYYNGLQNMYPQGISEVVESIFRIVFGLSLSILIRNIGLKQYNETGIIFRQTTFRGELIPKDRVEIALQVIAPFSSAAAILGVTISTAMGLLFLVIYSRRNGSQISKAQIATSLPASNNRELSHQLIRLAVPILLGSLVMSLSSMIDAVTIKNRVDFSGSLNPILIKQQFSQTLINMGQTDSAGNVTGLMGLGNALYGVYNMTTGVFNLIPSFTNYFGITILPQVTRAWIREDEKYMQHSVESVLKITSLVALPSAFIIIGFATDLLGFAYPNMPNSVAIAGPILSAMGISIFLVSLATPVNSMLQAIGRADLPVKFMAVGALLKLVSNYFFIGIPSINLSGVSIGTLICYAFIVVAGLISLLNITKVKISYVKTFLKPAISAFLGVFVGIALKSLLLGIIKSENYGVTTLILWISVFFSGFFYLIFLLLTGGVGKSDIILLPKGKNILKRLEKWRVIR